MTMRTTLIFYAFCVLHFFPLRTFVSTRLIAAQLGAGDSFTQTTLRFARNIYLDTSAGPHGGIMLLTPSSELTMAHALELDTIEKSPCVRLPDGHCRGCIPGAPCPFSKVKRATLAFQMEAARAETVPHWAPILFPRLAQAAANGENVLNVLEQRWRELKP